MRTYDIKRVRVDFMATLYNSIFFKNPVHTLSKIYWIRFFKDFLFLPFLNCHAAPGYLKSWNPFISILNFLSFFKIPTFAEFCICLTLYPCLSPWSMILTKLLQMKEGGWLGQDHGRVLLNFHSRGIADIQLGSQTE